MSLIPVAAPLIRLAAADEYRAQDLHDAVADQKLFTELVTAKIHQRELASMNPTEWRWYAKWRQALGGKLDPVLLKHLDVSATTRFARFEVRALVLRDPRTNEATTTLVGDHPPSDNVGLNWLREQAHDPRVDVVELCNDLLQCATEASGFLAKQLLKSGKDRGALARSQLVAFMEKHAVAGEIRERWGL